MKTVLTVMALCCLMFAGCASEQSTASPAMGAVEPCPDCGMDCDDCTSDACCGGCQAAPAAVEEGACPYTGGAAPGAVDGATCPVSGNAAPGAVSGDCGACPSTAAPGAVSSDCGGCPSGK